MNYYITAGGSQGRSNTSDVTWISRLGEPLKTDRSDIMGCLRGDVKCRPPLRSDVSSSELPIIWITDRITVNSTRPTSQTVREQPARFRPNQVHVATRHRPDSDIFLLRHAADTHTARTRARLRTAASRRLTHRNSTLQSAGGRRSAGPAHGRVPARRGGRLGTFLPDGVEANRRVAQRSPAAMRDEVTALKIKP